MIASRIADAGARAGVDVRRFDGPDQLPPAVELTLVLVAWDERRPDWGARLLEWCADAPQSAPPRIVLFGPHTDLAAHAEARAAGLGPMWARSKLLSTLPSVMSGDAMNP
ncbi:MAG: hypothetical protein ABI785_14555 [Gemmatimonadales bacterium]